MTLPGVPYVYNDKRPAVPALPGVPYVYNDKQAPALPGVPYIYNDKQVPALPGVPYVHVEKAPALPGVAYVNRGNGQALHRVGDHFPIRQYDDQPDDMSAQHYLSLVSAIALQLDRRFEFRTTGPVETRTPMGLGESESRAEIAEMFELFHQERTATDHGYWL